eukprot:UN30724
MWGTGTGAVDALILSPVESLNIFLEASVDARAALKGGLKGVIEFSFGLELYRAQTNLYQIKQSGVELRHDMESLSDTDFINKYGTHYVSNVGFGGSC